MEISIQNVFKVRCIWNVWARKVVLMVGTQA